MTASTTDEPAGPAVDPVAEAVAILTAAAAQLEHAGRRRLARARLRRATELAAERH